jgi:hypothetical protein
MRRLSFALVLFIALEYLAPLKAGPLALFALLLTVELAGFAILHRMGRERQPASRARGLGRGTLPLAR